MKTVYIPLLAGILTLSSVAFSQGAASANPTDDSCEARVTKLQKQVNTLQYWLQHPIHGKMIEDILAIAKRLEQQPNAQNDQATEIVASLKSVVDNARAAESVQLDSINNSIVATRNAIAANTQATNNVDADVIALDRQNKIESMKRDLQNALKTNNFNGDAYYPSPRDNRGNLVDLADIAPIGVGKLDVLKLVVENEQTRLAQEAVNNENPNIANHNFQDDAVTFYMAKAQDFYNNRNWPQVVSNYQKAYRALVKKEGHKFAPWEAIKQNFRNPPTVAPAPAESARNNQTVPPMASTTKPTYYNGQTQWVSNPDGSFTVRQAGQ